VIPRAVSSRRWGDKTRVEDEDEARERILDAAEVCFEQYGLNRTTMEDVSRVAKVSRSTVYRYFEGRGELIAAAYMRESATVFERLKILMSRPGTFADRVVESVLRAIDALRSQKYFPMLFGPEGALLSSQAITASAAFFEAGHAVMRPFFEDAKQRGEVRPELDLDDFIEWHLRIIFSFAMFDSPIPRDHNGLRRLIEDYIAPPLSASTRKRTNRRR
jgi:AcrR family transcriptional regulator